MVGCRHRYRKLRGPDGKVIRQKIVKQDVDDQPFVRCNPAKRIRTLDDLVDGNLEQGKSRTRATLHEWG